MAVILDDFYEAVSDDMIMTEYGYIPASAYAEIKRQEELGAQYTEQAEQITAYNRMQAELEELGMNDVQSGSYEDPYVQHTPQTPEPMVVPNPPATPAPETLPGKANVSKVTQASLLPQGIDKNMVTVGAVILGVIIVSKIL